MWKEVQQTRKKISPVQQLLCHVQLRRSLTTVRLQSLSAIIKKKIQLQKCTPAGN